VNSFTLSEEDLG